MADDVTRPHRRRVIAEAVAVGLAMGLIAFVAVAMPLYMIRSIDMAGDARTFVRNGVLRGAVPIGVVTAVVAGVAMGRWRWRNGTTVSRSGRRDSLGVTGPVRR